MMQDLSNFKLGVTIDGSRLRFVETELVDGKRLVTNIAEKHLDIPFDFYVIGNEELIPTFAQALDELAVENNIRADQAFLRLKDKWFC